MMDSARGWMAPSDHTYMVATERSDDWNRRASVSFDSIRTNDTRLYDPKKPDQWDLWWQSHGSSQLAEKHLLFAVEHGPPTAADIAAQAQANGGTATLKTVQGEELKVSADPNDTWVITDAKGGKSTITQADVAQSNGVVHVVDAVLMP